MIKRELQKRLITSIFLLVLLYFMLNYSYVLISSLLIISVITWYEINILIKKIFKKNDFFLKKVFILLITFFYLIFFSYEIINEFLRSMPKISWVLLYVITICVLSDAGGFIFGKFFKGKKLTRTSPNKTYSGAIGSFILSIIFSIIFSSLFNDINFFNGIFYPIVISLICQLGDLLISFLKRKAKVKDTGNILPGHGGILDRIDGILFALPLGILLINYTQ